MTILICDDEKTIREGIINLLSNQFPKINLITASNGIEALQLFNQYQPTVVLLDINMPGLSGIGLLQNIKSAISQTKVIIISGYDDFDTVKNAMKLGAFEYLLKPIRPQQLIDLINTILFSKKDHDKVIDSIQPSSLKEQVIYYIYENYCDSDLSLAYLSEEFNVSESYLTRIIKETTNLNFTDLLTHLRIEKAKSLLLNSSLLIVEISEEIGYASQHYFSRVFKKHVQESPISYRSRNNKRYT